MALVEKGARMTIADYLPAWQVKYAVPGIECYRQLRIAVGRMVQAPYEDLSSAKQQLVHAKGIWDDYCNLLKSRENDKA